MFLPLLPTVPLRLRGQGPPRSYFLFDIKQTARRTYLLSAFAGMRSRRKNFCVQLGFGACTNKYRLAKWIARRIACWNFGTWNFGTSKHCLPRHLNLYGIHFYRSIFHASSAIGSPGSSKPKYFSKKVFSFSITVCFFLSRGLPPPKRETGGII